MKANLKYASYVVRHKLFVYQAGRKLKVPLAQLIFHDWQKLLPIEWIAYREFFYGKRDKEAFDRAWLHHQKVGGKHHWQYWVLVKDNGSHKALEMPDRYRREMLADWIGAGKAIPNAKGVHHWYQANGPHIVLHNKTRAWLEAELERLKNDR